MRVFDSTPARKMVWNASSDGSATWVCRYDIGENAAGSGALLR
jgi:hypothetical protein